jgi:hypothetical protein
MLNYSIEWAHNESVAGACLLFAVVLGANATVADTWHGNDASSFETFLVVGKGVARTK